MFVNETEHTGPVVRVWVGSEDFLAEPVGDGALEDVALALAKEHLGRDDILGEVVFHMAPGFEMFEIIFEAGDLA